MIFCANPAAQFYSYQDEIEEAILKVLRSNQYILGPELNAFEKEFAGFINTKFAIGVANGTDALEIAIKSLDLKPEDEIITVSHTAVATVSAIYSAGAIPVLVDVDSKFYTLDESQLNEVLTPKTKAIIAVHLYGQSANLDLLLKFCEANNLYLIEDVSQAHGAKWEGKRLGSVGHISCFSCYPTKNLGAIGDAGIICTNNLMLAEKVKMLRQYGWKERYISQSQGRNSRLDEIQASVLRIKLKYLDSDNRKRQKIAERYSNSLPKEYLFLPETRDQAEHVYHLYVVRIKNNQRDALIEYLKLNNIQTGIHYPLPIHCQPAYLDRIRRSGVMQVTEEIAGQVLSLPIYPELTKEEVDKVILNIKSFFST